jgi:hypothetical protein
VIDDHIHESYQSRIQQSWRFGRVLACMLVLEVALSMGREKSKVRWRVQVEPSVIAYAQARFDALGEKGLPAGFKPCMRNFLKTDYKFECAPNMPCTNHDWCTIDKLTERLFEEAPDDGCTYAPTFPIRAFVSSSVSERCNAQDC